MTGASDFPSPAQTRAYPEPAAVLELLKPITWFPPMWAFARGVISFAAPGPAPDPIVIEGLAPAVSGASLYETGLLFHGPQLRHLIELQRGQNGAVARLEAASLGAPQGVLNVGLIDGMIQIAHDRHENRIFVRISCQSQLSIINIT